MLRTVHNKITSDSLSISFTMSSKESELVSLHKVSDNEEEEYLIKKPNPVVMQPTEDDLLLASSTFDDILAAINDAKILAPLLAICVLLAGLYISTTPLHPHSVRTPRLSHEEFVSEFMP